MAWHAHLVAPQRAKSVDSYDLFLDRVVAGEEIVVARQAENLGMLPERCVCPRSGHLCKETDSLRGLRYLQ